MSVAFDPTAADARLERLWKLNAIFGVERPAQEVYLEEIVSDRYALVNGLQLLRDELQFALPGKKPSDLIACAADFSLPSVVPTLAYTNCGDRIHQGEATQTYREMVGSRFAALSEIGELKLESFSPAGGGTDDGATLANITVAHQLDAALRERLYAGNSRSFVVVAIDLMTHVGRLELDDGTVGWGLGQESPWRAPRPSCGAIMGMLRSYNPENGVHRRLRRDLGEDNFALINREPLRADDGTDVTAAVAAAIVAIRGMRSTLEGLAKELDERGVGHVTASLTVNRSGEHDTLIYLARGTIFGGEIRFQGLGTQASKYRARKIKEHGTKRLALIYEDVDGAKRPTKKHLRPAFKEESSDGLAVEKSPER